MLYRIGQFGYKLSIGKFFRLIRLGFTLLTWETTGKLVVYTLFSDYLYEILLIFTKQSHGIG